MRELQPHLLHIPQLIASSPISSSDTKGTDTEPKLRVRIRREAVRPSRGSRGNSWQLYRGDYWFCWIRKHYNFQGISAARAPVFRPAFPWRTEVARIEKLWWFREEKSVDQEAAIFEKKHWQHSSPCLDFSYHGTGSQSLKPWGWLGRPPRAE